LLGIETYIKAGELLTYVAEKVAREFPGPSKRTDLDGLVRDRVLTITLTKRNTTTHLD
jgi:hypothetical protein